MGLDLVFRPHPHQLVSFLSPCAFRPNEYSASRLCERRIWLGEEEGENWANTRRAIFRKCRETQGEENYRSAQLHGHCGEHCRLCRLLQIVVNIGAYWCIMVHIGAYWCMLCMLCAHCVHIGQYAPICTTICTPTQVPRRVARAALRASFGSGGFFYPFGRIHDGRRHQSRESSPTPSCPRKPQCTRGPRPSPPPPSLAAAPSSPLSAWRSELGTGRLLVSCVLCLSLSAGSAWRNIGVPSCLYSYLVSVSQELAAGLHV